TLSREPISHRQSLRRIGKHRRLIPIPQSVALRESERSIGVPALMARSSSRCVARASRPRISPSSVLVINLIQNRDVIAFVIGGIAPAVLVVVGHTSFGKS